MYVYTSSSHKLGSKIGKNVYWPGSGVDVVEFDLLEIGDDVVFGSRSEILLSTATRMDKVVIEDGCMLADRYCETAHTQHMHSTYSVHNQYMHNIYTVHAQHIISTCTTHTQYMHNTYTASTQHIQMHEQYLNRAE
jgi:acetyltransferase-like isoleucine patch superfamily enzyme